MFTSEREGTVCGLQPLPKVKARGLLVEMMVFDICMIVTINTLIKQEHF